MTSLTLAYAIENKFTAVDCVKYFKPNWTLEECSEYLVSFTCYPFDNKQMINQLNKQLTEPEQHTVVGC
jgi:hypothetical protein